MVGGTRAGLPLLGRRGRGPARRRRSRTRSPARDMLYSSGTTGRPKGVKRRRRAGPQPIDAPNAADACCAPDALRHGREHDLSLAGAALSRRAAALHHDGPARWAAPCVIMEKFDAEDALRLIEKYKVTHSPAGADHVRAHAEAAGGGAPQVRRLVADAAPSTPPRPARSPVKAQMIDWWGPIIIEYYAGTEGNGVTRMQLGGMAGAQGHGRPRRRRQDPDLRRRRQRAARRRNRARSISPTAAQFDYHNDPKKTAARLQPRGWSTLGDVGYVDEDGYLYLTDRKAFMIISGGVNIYPQETENLLITHPKVADVAVFGVPQRGDRRGGEGGGAAARHGRAGERLRGRTDRLLPAASVADQMSAHRSTSIPNCRARPPASCTSGCCATATGRRRAERRVLVVRCQPLHSISAGALQMLEPKAH